MVPTHDLDYIYIFIFEAANTFIFKRIALIYVGNIYDVVIYGRV